MTAPVQQQAQAANTKADSMKIAMTSPVELQAQAQAWRVSFVMPSEYDMASLPLPNNDRVTLTQVPEKHFAVIQFSGTHAQENLSKHEQQLLNYMESSGLQALAPPKYAFYNPPWTLPGMRRNEIMVEIDYSARGVRDE